MGNTYRKRVEEEVLDLLIKGLSSGDLTVEQAQSVAKETLLKLEDIEKHEDRLLEFYRKLSSEFPPFKLLYTRVKGEILQGRELVEYKMALVAIEAGNIAEATEILKTAMEKSANEAKT